MKPPQSAHKSKGKGKSVAKSKGKKSEKKKHTDEEPSTLKRAKMNDKHDLTNEEDTSVA